MPEAPYYQGDEIPLKFKVTEKFGKPIEIQSVTVSIATPEEVFEGFHANIDGNTVSFIVRSEWTKPSGDYSVSFTVNVDPDIVRTHIIRFRLLPLEPIFSEEKDKNLMPVDKDSDDDQVEGSIAMAIRSLRRAGHEIMEAAKVSRDLAEKMTNRRLPRE